MYKEALKGYEKIEDPEHLDIMNTLHGIGQIQTKLMNFNEANLIFQRILIIYKKVYSINHPNNYFELLYDIGELEMEKIKFNNKCINFDDLKLKILLVEECLNGRINQLGNENKDTLKTKLLLDYLIKIDSNM